eukprot:TRINITY_DN9454_c0_g1_i3.p1 TRINITY_DN9454_c0_g1~~TRINITY_DN9454_c0_g1_i3.p1  ORF type:complete len:277 (-),score=37.02 TRINITY_DN9454_c0_g1_i3:2-832(-)
MSFFGDNSDHLALVYSLSLGTLALAVYDVIKSKDGLINISLARNISVPHSGIRKIFPNASPPCLVVDNGTLLVYDLTTGDQLASYYAPNQCKEGYSSLDMTPDGRYIIAEFEQHGQNVYTYFDWQVDGPLRFLALSKGYAYSPDGKRLVSEGQFSSMNIYDIEKNWNMSLLFFRESPMLGRTFGWLKEGIAPIVWFDPNGSIHPCESFFTPTPTPPGWTPSMILAGASPGDLHLGRVYQGRGMFAFASQHHTRQEGEVECPSNVVLYDLDGATANV